MCPNQNRWDPPFREPTCMRALVGVEILVVSLSELETRTLLQNKIDQFLLHILSCVG